MGAGPMNLEWALICGQASVQQPQVMQVERTYIASCTLGLILGPNPRSSASSTSTHAFTRFKFSNMMSRSTTRSLINGNLVIGAIVTILLLVDASSCWINAVHPCRGRPLINMEQEPHTSSRHPCSQATGVTFSPLRLSGFFCTSIKAAV